MSSVHFDRFVRNDEEGLYITIPFSVPSGIESLSIRYSYPRYAKINRDSFEQIQERSIIDFGLNMPEGKFVGASGAEQTEIHISPFGSSRGYTNVEVLPGEWEIILGAYRIPQEGTLIRYIIEFYPKSIRLYKGDMHTHTTGSDGALSLQELAKLCQNRQLDFVFVTNHNSWFENMHLPQTNSLTIIAGVEWTHYKGHANFLGICKPYRNPFCINTPQEARQIIAEAKENGAMIVFNHPFCQSGCGWMWGMDIFPMDAVEIWNGAFMLGSNLDCLNWWHNELCTGRMLPIVGGSDFHDLKLSSLPGIPTTSVYAWSRSSHDLLTALLAGCCYITFAPDGPQLEMLADHVYMGGIAKAGATVTAKFSQIQGGDILRLITERDIHEQICPLGTTEITIQLQSKYAIFVRCEVLRSFEMCILPAIRILVSNPIYFR